MLNSRIKCWSFFFVIGVCQNKGFWQVLPKWNFLFYLKCWFKTVGFTVLLFHFRRGKKKLMGLFLSENLIKCCKGVEDSLIKFMCLECAPKWACMVVREGEVTIGVLFHWLPNSSRFFYLDSNLIALGLFQQSSFWRHIFTIQDLASAGRGFSLLCALLPSSAGRAAKGCCGVFAAKQTTCCFSVCLSLCRVSAWRHICIVCCKFTRIIWSSAIWRGLLFTETCK